MFKQHPPFRDVLQDDWGTIANTIIGNTLVSIFFMSIGIVILLYAPRSKNKPAAYWIAMCFVFCAISRALSVLNVWYGWYGITGIVTTFTGLVSIVALYFVAKVAWRIDELKSISELQDGIEKTEEKLRTLENLKNDSASTTDMV